jgi:integrase
VTSCHIIVRDTKKSGKRYIVRYRISGGDLYSLIHGGSFRTMKEARIRRDLIAGELAAARDPRIALAALTKKPHLTVAQWTERYAASRVDYAEETVKNVRSHLIRINNTLAGRDPQTLTVADVQEWVAANSDLKPSSVRRYLATLRQLLDFAGVDPNPARDKNLRTPREEHEEIEPPTEREVAALIAALPRAWKLPIRVLEQTGMRIGELAAMTWGDVDRVNLRLRVRAGKTRSARRFVPVPGWLLEEIEATCPPDDRVADRRLFVGFNSDVAKNAMARACRAAGLRHMHPHDLRHRYASVKIREGVPLTDLSAHLGHSRKSLTLDTYSHVLIEED